MLLNLLGRRVSCPMGGSGNRGGDPMVQSPVRPSFARGLPVEPRAVPCTLFLELDQETGGADAPRRIE